tara:strand:- start:1968 stop:2180 length:213 start_codon:yes stop_codon:yes gene_type:complete
MFGFINSIIDESVKIVDDAIDVGLAVVTLGEYGELSKDNVTRLIAAGLTIYAISEATGVAVDLIERALDE